MHDVRKQRSFVIEGVRASGTFEYWFFLLSSNVNVLSFHMFEDMFLVQAHIRAFLAFVTLQSVYQFFNSLRVSLKEEDKCYSQAKNDIENIANLG